MVEGAHPPTADELLALANVRCQRERVGIGGACNTSDKRDLCATCRRNVALREAAGAIARLTADNEQRSRLIGDLTMSIHGCACSPPYDECPHDEPLLRQIERQAEQIRVLKAVYSELRSGRG